MKRKAKYIFLITAAALGLSLIIFPLLSGSSQQEEVDEVIINWREKHPSVSETPSHSPILPAENIEETGPATEPFMIYPELLAEMQAHNRYLVDSKQSDFTDRQAIESETIHLTEFGLEKDEPVGIITIPSLEVTLPVYLGSSYDNMAMGFAQLSYTSLPIGGPDTHCVVAGHRGWHGAEYLRNAHEMVLGDRVILENFWGVMEYEVVEIKTVLPYETEHLLIQPGRELLTLLTCTPYGVGSHRLLITCERINNNNS